jgi:hypothetical protein
MLYLMFILTARSECTDRMLITGTCASSWTSTSRITTSVARSHDEVLEPFRDSRRLV